MMLKAGILPWILGVNLLVRVDAYGKRGAAEHVLYYYAYLAEEILAPSDGYKIATDCKGSAKGGRCNFNEFLHHIWAPKHDGEKRPNIPNLVDGDDKFGDINLDKLMKTIFKDKGLLEGGNGQDQRIWCEQTDSDRLYKGLTKPAGEKWGEALRKIGGVIGAARQKEGLKEEENKILNKAKLTADIAHDVRLQDLEEYRLYEVQDIIGRHEKGPIPVMKRGPRSSTFVEPFDVIDIKATVDKNKADVPDIEDVLKNAFDEWSQRPGDPRTHFEAYKAVKEARQSCACNRP